MTTKDLILTLIMFDHYHTRVTLRNTQIHFCVRYVASDEQDLLTVERLNDTLVFIVLAASRGKRNVMVWSESVCPVGILNATHQGTARDSASTHSGLTIRTYLY